MVLAQGLLFSYFFLYMYLYKWKGLECSVVICWCYILHLFSLITESARWFWADVFLFLTAVEHFILRFAICNRKEICGWGKNPIMVLYSIVWSVNIPAELHVGKKPVQDRGLVRGVRIGVGHETVLNDVCVS